MCDVPQSFDNTVAGFRFQRTNATGTPAKYLAPPSGSASKRRSSRHDTNDIDEIWIRIRGIK